MPKPKMIPEDAKLLRLAYAILRDALEIVAAYPDPPSIGPKEKKILCDGKVAAAAARGIVAAFEGTMTTEQRRLWTGLDERYLAECERIESLAA